MTSVAVHARTRRLRPSALAAAAAAAAAAALLGVMALGIGTAQVPLGHWLAAGIGGLAVLALALWRYEAAVVLGLILLGVVRFEPAPVDGVFAIVIAVSIVTGRFDPKAAPLWILGVIGAFLAMNLLACIEVTKVGRAATFVTITTYLLVFAVWMAGFVDSTRRARLVLRWTIATATVSALLGTLALQISFPGSTLMTDKYGARAMGLFKDPNVYGPFLVVGAILLLTELLEPRLLRLRTLYKLVGLAILMVGVLFAYSRAAWLNFAVGVVVLMCVLPLRRGGGKRAVALLVAAILGLTAVGVTVSLTGSGNFLSERAHIQTYDSQRFGAQELGLRIAQDHPVGVGPGQFETVAPISAHSTYVRALAEEGGLGFVLLVTLLFGTLLIAVTNVIGGRETFGISSVGLLAIWCGILANSLFVDTLHWRHLWLAAGLIWAGATIPRRFGAQASSRLGARTPT